MDEFIIVLTLAIFTLHGLKKRGKLRRAPGTKWFFLFLLAGVISGLISGAPINTLALGTVYAAKSFLYLFGVTQLHWTESGARTVVRSFAASGLIVAASGILNVMFPSAWSAVFSPSGSYEVRFGLPSILGPFDHPTVFAFVTSLLSVGFFAFWRLNPTSRKSLWLSLISGIESILGMRRRLWLALIAAITAVIVRTRGTANIILLVVIIGPLAVFASWQFINEVFVSVAGEYFSEGSQLQAARTAMTAGSVDIANSGFGFGAGFGQFGSWVAALHYSPLYIERGYQRVYGLAPLEWHEANYLTDTFWPAVLGESGWLGFLFYALFLLTVFKFFYQNAKESSLRPQLRWLLTAGIGWSMLYLVDSFASPTYTAPLSMLYFGLLGICFALADDNAEEDNRERTIA